jgi:hypothetical protein
MKPTFGCDPEIFVVNETGTFVAPTRYIMESKVVMAVSVEGGANRDGMAVELNPEPSHDPGVVERRLDILKRKISIQLATLGLKMSEEIMLDTRESFIDPMAQDVWDIGCVPDLDAYTENWRQVPVSGRQYPYRYAGGHISIGGFGNITRVQACEIVRERFDPSIGLLSTLSSKNPEASAQRRQIYGGAGAFRLKDGIIEYRTPDSGWLWGSSGKYETLCIRAEMALGSDTKMSQEFFRQVPIAINSCDIELAKTLYDEWTRQ